eukprot:UN27041
MLKLQNLNYKSDPTIIFQRLSVMCLDFVFLYSIIQFLSSLPSENNRFGVLKSETTNKYKNLILLFITFGNYGLL